MHSPIVTTLVLLAALLSVRDTLAQVISVPVTLPYPLIETILSDQLSTGSDGRAELFNDGKDCNTLSLESPSVAGAGNGHVSLQTRLNARGGTPIGSRCVPLFNWTGTLNTVLAPYISADGSRLGFHITQSDLEKDGTGQSAIPGAAWNWIKAYVHPELERMTIDLRPLLEATSALLNTASPDDGVDIAPWLDSVIFSHVSGDMERLEVTLRLELAETPPLAAGISTAVLTDTEIARWDAAWQSWDAFVAWLIKDLNSQLAARNPALTEALATSFLEARYELRRVLTENDPSRDAVRDLFVTTWSRLAPLLRQELSDENELAPLKLLTFISAVDALLTVDNVAQQFAIRFDDATFRALARLINSTVTDDQLSYTTDVDPALRRLLGLDPDFEDGEPNSSLKNFRMGALSLLIPRAQAAAPDSALVDRLTGWVPARVELDSYLAAVNLLLDSILETERTKDRVPSEYLEIHEYLVLATAWQESCWRQFENRDGQVAPLQSSAGSVGMMQVNRHVWRGIYDPLKLEENIAYNARAGNEILVHYLVDYALKHREHELPGGADNLAKATYAMYNGGPRHLSRYRDTTTGGTLKKIDTAFWGKYRALRKEGVGAVKTCYGES